MIRTETTRRTSTATPDVSASTASSGSARPSASPAYRASRSGPGAETASRSAGSRAEKAIRTSQALGTALEVDSRLSSPTSGASSPPRSDWARDPTVSSATSTSPASSPAVRADDQPAPSAVPTWTSSSTPAAIHRARTARRDSRYSQECPASRPRSATARADRVSSSETHWREAPADRDRAAGRPWPAANSSRFSRKAATARRCPSRAPWGQSSQVQAPPWVLLGISWTATCVPPL